VAKKESEREKKRGRCNGQEEKRKENSIKAWKKEKLRKV
jgi:hypothetical protein